MRKFFPRQLTLALGVLECLFSQFAIRSISAQSPPPPAHRYEVVSIHPAAPGERNSGFSPGAQGGLKARNDTVMQLLMFAYEARDYQFVGIPAWAQSERYEVNLTPERSEIIPNAGTDRAQYDGWLSRSRERLQAVLHDRFGLELRRELRELPIYGLSVAKTGHKLTVPADPGKGPSLNINGGQRIIAKSSTMKSLAEALSMLLGRFVHEETGLEGLYDFKLEFAPDLAVQALGNSRPAEPASADVALPSIFTALPEQLGLRLESKKGPVTVFVIGKIDKPSEN